MGIVSKPIIAKIGERYQVRQDSAEQLQTGNVLVPITDADALLRIPKIQNVQANGTDRTDSYVVPAGKRWRLRRVAMTRENTGEIYCWIYNPDGTQFALIALAVPTAAALYSVDLDISIDFGWRIDFLFNTGVSGFLESYVLYEEESLT